MRKTKVVECLICGGKFKRKGMTIQQEGVADRRVYVLQCVLCGDTQGSPEQALIQKNKKGG